MPEYQSFKGESKELISILKKAN